MSDWVNLVLRWIHLIAGISWIGTSFYFIWLDNHLTLPPPETARGGVEGQLWMVHSGGFYRVEKQRLGAGQVPKPLHWFKWEAALTWISGISLLILIYYLSGGLYLVDPAVSRISPGAATALGVGLLVASWFVYDLLWRSSLGRHSTLAAAISFVLVAGVAFGLCRLLSGRAAYIHVGSMLGTLMVANVWLRILPAQQQMIDATQEGRQPDITLGRQAKRRSVHNSYMTFPVLFIMLSNHYPTTYAHRLNWLILILLILAGAGARHVLIAKQGSGYWALPPVAGALVVLVLLTAPPRAPTTGEHVSFAAVQAVINRRCVACHSANPTEHAFVTAPNGIAFDTPETIRKLAERINVRAVITKTMPLGNVTGMTQAERDLLARWIDEGADLK